MRTAENAEESREPELNQLTGQVVDAAIKVHSAVGPGLLESDESGDELSACLRALCGKSDRR